MEINGYKIKYNDFWMTYQVSHENIGANIAEFEIIYDAILYCQKG